MNIIRCLTLVLPLSSGIVSTPTLADLYATTSFETTYTAYDPSGSLAWQFRLQIYTPTAAGTYPIAIVVGGSGACQDPPVCSSGYGTYATIVAQDAAKRGMVAAAVHYDSAYRHFCGCTGSENWTGTALDGSQMQCAPSNDGWDDKARAIFDHADANSALRRIIAATANRAARADLARGLAVFGHSQGSWLARLADGYTQANDGRAVDGRCSLVPASGSISTRPSTPTPFQFLARDRIPGAWFPPVACARSMAARTSSSASTRCLILAHLRPWAPGLA